MLPLLLALLALLPSLLLAQSRERLRLGETVPIQPSTTYVTNRGAQTVWRAEFTSRGAAAIRLHFENFQAGDATVRVLAPITHHVVAEYGGEGLFNDGEFWSEVVPGDTAIVEYEASGDPPFSIREAAHFYPPPSKQNERSLLGCHIDINNFPEWLTLGNAVALLVFETSDNQGPFWAACTGTLVADRSRTGRALLVTAHHCIHTEAEARSLRVYRDYQRAPGSFYPYYSTIFETWFYSDERYRRQAQILSTVGPSEGDATLLELLGPLPDVWLRPNSAPYSPLELPMLGGTATIHHPDASFKRISQGNRVAPLSGADTGIRIDGKFRPTDYYYKITETLGVTEGGSSGAPAFTAATTAILGTLSYGPPESCSASNAHGIYGRSSVFYPRIQHILHGTNPGACNVEISALNQTIPSAAFQSTFQITAPATCHWAVASDSEHISVNTHAGTGSATISYQVAANTQPPSRIGSISVIGEQRRVFHILQRGTDAAAPYSDLTANHPFTEEIKLLKLRNVTAYGCPQPSSFCPEATTTRGQMAEFIIRAIYNGDNFPAPINFYGDFSDLPPQHPAYRYVQKMRELRITDGCTATTYCPEDPVTRGQMAAFVTRALQVKNGLDSRAPFSFSSQTYFSDNSPLNPFHSAVQKMKEVGITSGCTATSYCINDPNTRGQIAVFLARGLFALWEGR
jgi:hypothetical protein